jgi:hypothetical protein
VKPVAVLLLAAGVAVLVWFAASGGDGRTIPAAAAAERAAVRWTGGGSVQPARRDGALWEVDVRRANGSLVEVTLGRGLVLYELDEERGPGGRRPHDEITGRLRGRAITAARREAPEGTVRTVERERDGSIEVDFITSAPGVLEVELDSELRITGVDHEELGDE